MSPAASAFLQFWLTDRARDTFLSYVPKDDLPTFRLACHDFGVRAAPLLFKELSITFRASTFSKPGRMAALDRIGHHVDTLTFNMPHGPESFLPPLLDRMTGEEQTFIYEPHMEVTSRLSVPKYGSWEMTDLLVKQYPPLFHAAANVPSFTRAFSALKSLKHLKISCPGQDAAQRYRRSIVDYALISLRIAVERSGLTTLDTLSLLSVHPGALLYLNPITGLGALPNSARRWRQIRKLTIHMDNIPAAREGLTDHLKLLHSYLQTFVSSLRRFSFRWLGDKGPCPLSLGTEPSLEVSSPRLACPKRYHLALRPLRFEKLRYAEVETSILDATQISNFIMDHRHTLREFNFEDVVLRSGTWDEALSPLTRISGSEKWKEKTEEVMDVPLVLSPVGMDEGEMKKVLQAQLRMKLPSGSWQRASAKTKELLFGTPEHMKRFMKSSVLAWR